MKPAKKFIYMYREAGSGEFVTEEYAKANPTTTVREKIVLQPKKGADEAKKD